MKVIDDLFKNKNIVILKQDKGRSVLDTKYRTKYTEKCMVIPNVERLKKVTIDPTAATERCFEKNKI